MYLQRLILDDTVGFNYDYMGSAEYEFGATAHGRMALAKGHVDNEIEARRITFTEVLGRHASDPIDVVIAGKSQMLDELGEEARIKVTKEAFRTTNSNIVGWMNVGHDSPEPLLILRADCPDIQNRINKFLAGPLAALKEQADG